MYKGNIALGFDKKTGKIKQIGAPPIDAPSQIQVPYEIAGPILEGKVSKNNFRVIYNPETKKFELKETDSINKTTFDINDFHHSIPYSYSNKDCTIEKDNTTKVWRIILSDELCTNMKGMFVGETLNFSVTKHGDLNILYRFLRVDIEELCETGVIEIPFTTDDECNLTKLSIYTPKRFKDYGFRVKNET